MSFSVVTVLHRSRPVLERLLASVERQLDPRPELIVVDTGPDDGGAALARDAGVNVIELRENPGFGAANNAGVAAATNEVTVLLNPDVELLDDGLTQLVEVAGNRDVLAAPRLIDDDGEVEHSVHRPPGRIGNLIPAVIHPRLLPPPLRTRFELWRAKRSRRVGWAVAACIAARTQTLRRLGPFDPHAFLFYEDLDLCLRARAQGIVTELYPEVRLRHSGAHSTRLAYLGEPYELLARRRREVIGSNLDGRALALDDAAQALTFATRALLRPLTGRDSSRPRAQLRALRAARRG
jgi:GT2 family glycosyltransferase